MPGTAVAFGAAGRHPQETLVWLVLVPSLSTYWGLLARRLPNTSTVKDLVSERAKMLSLVKH